MKIKWFNRDENFSYSSSEAVTNYPAFSETRSDQGYAFIANNPAYDETHQKVTAVAGSLGGLLSFDVDDADMTVDADGNISRAWIQNGGNYTDIDYTVVIASSASGSKFYKSTNVVISTELFTAELISFEAGSFGRYLHETFEVIVSGKVASDATVQYLSSNNEDFVNPNVTLNPDWFMSAYDLAFASVMCEVAGSNDDSPSAVLISPRHAIAAKHYGAGTGSTLIFRRSDGGYETVTVLDTTEIWNDETNLSTDINVLYLSADVNIPYAKVLPKDWVARYCPVLQGELITNNAICRLPFMCRTSWNLDVTVLNSSSSKIRMAMQCDTKGDPEGVLFNHDIARISSLSSWSNKLDNGDSGSPGFVPVNGGLVFLYTSFGSTTSQDIAWNKAKIEAAMDTMAGQPAGTYVLSHPDMSSFKDYTQQA